MGDQKKGTEKEQSSELEDSFLIAARKAKKYLVNQEMLARVQKKKDQRRRQARRYAVNTDLLEANGIPGNGSQIIDLSMNGARLKLPYSPPFMSQMVLKFNLQGSSKLFHVVGRVIWSRAALQRGWFEVGVQFYQNYWEIDHLIRLEMR